MANDNELPHIELLANTLDEEISQRNVARIEKTENNQILTIQKQLRSLILKLKRLLLNEKSMICLISNSLIIERILYLLLIVVWVKRI